MRSAVRSIIVSLVIMVGATIVPGVTSADLVDQRRLFELGGYLGAFFPSSTHELYERGTTHEQFDDAVIDLGLRVSYLHFFFLGIEAELGMMPTGTSSVGGAEGEREEGAAFVYTARAHAILQYPVAEGLAPFAVMGGGLLGVASSFARVGADVDPVFHWGLGGKYYVNRSLAARAEFRHTIGAGLGFGNADHFEFLLGAAWVIGWRSDTDGDGVFDGDDRCPRVKSDRRDGCPAADRDGDGVDDEHDKCPAERGLDSDGCPPEEEDVDGDGIAVPADKCPRKAETVNGFDDDDGCPDELPDPVQEFNAAVQGVVTFRSGKAAVSKESFELLDRAAAVLKKYPKLNLAVRGSHRQRRASRAQCGAIPSASKGRDRVSDRGRHRRRALHGGRSRARRAHRRQQDA
jgi:OOP family OmpA-OmpF porin